MVPRTDYTKELKSDEVFRFYKKQASGDSALRRRIEAGIAQSRLIIVDPTVRASVAKQYTLPGNAAREEILRQCVLEDLLHFDTPLWDLRNKEVVLPSGVGISTQHLGQYLDSGGILDPHKLVGEVGRSKKNPSKPKLIEGNILRFAAQLTSACIDISHPHVWHTKRVRESGFSIPRSMAKYQHQVEDLRNSCSRGKWFDDNFPDALRGVLDAIAADVNDVNRVFGTGSAGTKLGKFDAYAQQVEEKDGPWRYASDIAAGFARLWYQCDLKAVTDPAEKARRLGSRYKYLIYNGHVTVPLPWID